MATHGFFAPDGVSSSPQEQIFLNILQEGRMERLVKGHIKDPLLRSGLALAGANTWMREEQLPDSAENGILTAVDVANMDLQGTELVVLSACQTGLGDVHDGEGVFGLRRAFVIAGAKRLVMSLWRVPDQQTQELMSLFYEALRRGIPCHDALHEAQQCLKQTHTHPFYWGAFICQGDPAPLPTSVFQRSTGGASIKVSSDSSKAQRQNHKRNGG
jgi:CHAT domain-containing protein